MDHYIILYIANLCLNVSLFALIRFAYLIKAYFCLIYFVRFATNQFLAHPNWFCDIFLISSFDLNLLNDATWFFYESPF